jgi:soluble lytic murein transglycosylase
LYNRVADKYPNSNYAAISLWNVFWSSYEAKNYEAAKKVMTRYFKACDNPAYNPKMLFWMGKTCLKLRKINEANGYFNKILTKYPDDYYAYRADAVLKHTESHWGLVSHHNIDERDFNIEFPIKYSNMDIKDFKLINMLLELGDYEIWKEVKFENKFVASWFKYKSGQKAESILLAKQGLDELDIKPPFNDDVYKLAYPIYWGDEINHYSTNYNLDSYLIISIIREESHFSPKSISRTGAVGLMQLMPSTASYIASKYDNISYHSRRELKNPNKNIELGTTYFTFIKTSLYNNVLAVAGYNGGPNAIKSWQIKNKYADLDEFVENIPYSETQTYVKKVYKSYWNYLNIYNY